MPKFEVNQYGEDQELIFKPTDGDIKYREYGALERWQSGAWTYIGSIDDLFREHELMKVKLAEVDNWMLDKICKDQAQVIADELEDKFDDLREAGEHLRQLEKMLRIARKTYDALTDDVKARLKTFERLDTPYPDDEEGPGYSI